MEQPANGRLHEHVNHGFALQLHSVYSTYISSIVCRVAETQPKTPSYCHTKAHQVF